MMPANKTQEITKDIVDVLLKELANRYRRIDKKGYQPVDIVIVGGGSILLNYSFRQSTVDIDAILHVSSAINDIAIDLSKEYDISPHWLNSDFMILSSYSKRLESVSQHYRSYNNGKFNIRTINAEYLIAMKMQAGRLYNNDLPDIIGILASEKQKGNNITFDKIEDALEFLYDNLTVQDVMRDKVREYCELDVDQLWEEYEKVKGQTQLVNSEIMKTDNKDKIKDKNDAKMIGSQLFNDIIKDNGTIKDPELKAILDKQNWSAPSKGKSI